MKFNIQLPKVFTTIFIPYFEFKPFFNHGYDKNIGFVFSKYCFTLNHDAEELQIINEKIHLHPRIHFNSCVFILKFYKLILCGGIGEYEETVPIKCMKGRVGEIDMNEQVIIGIITTQDGPKCFTVGDPNFYATDVPESIQQEIFKERDEDSLIPMCTANICSVLNTATHKLYSWGNFDDKNEILPPEEILKNVRYVEKNKNRAISAFFNDNTIVAWGNPMFGGKIPETMIPLLKNIKVIVSTEGAFAALSHDGKVVAWGHPNFGGNPSEEIQSQLYNVQILEFDDQHFQVRFTDGREDLVWP